ncbi:MAG: efflux transporter outer membrane subunit [Verrucomicrobiota bacterium]|jgi:NodT family efflux transporter outer membrane factor (OMF) lipoprotein
MALTRKSLPFLLALALMLIAGCAVGPNFKKPDAPNVISYIASPLTNTETITHVTGGEAQRFVEGADISGEWWTMFHSKPLSDLVERSLKANPNIKAAQAALVVAREAVLAQRGAYYPSVSGGFSASRQRTSELLAPIPNANIFTYSLYTPQVSVSYVPDVFGLNRRTVESLNAQAAQQRFALAATYITLSANVVSAAIQEASLRGQIAATHQLIDENTKALDILRAQFAKGYASRLDLAAQESQLAQVVATLPPLVKQLAQQRDALAVLVGGFPAQGPAETFELSSLELPRDLPLSLPSRLVEQRPDVRQAGENLHAASAQIGVAIANRIPNITLTASAGSSALALDQLFTSGTGFWSLGAAAAQPIFQGGMLLHKERAAKAACVQAAEQYRNAVLTAFQNVADTLNALEQDANALKAAVAAEHAARVTLDLTQNQLRAGYANYLTLISAETAYQQAGLNLVQARANRFADTAALFLALGGGWWHRADIPKS